jgi:hypothetical protein
MQIMNNRSFGYEFHGLSTMVSNLLMPIDEFYSVLASVGAVADIDDLYRILFEEDHVLH